MKTTILLLIALFLKSTPYVFAGPSQVEFGTKSELKIKDVNLSDNVAVTGVKSITLKRVASGLRYKKIAFLTANVYVGQLFTEGRIDQSSLATLKESVLQNLPAVMTLTFLRDVSAEKLSNGFKETLSENSIKTDEVPYSKFLEAVKTGGEMKEGESYQLLFIGSVFSISAHGKEIYRLEAATKEILGSFMMIWFGKAPDSGLEGLQKDLLKH